MKLEPQKYLAVPNGLWSRLESTQVDLDLQVESSRVKSIFKSTFEVLVVGDMGSLQSDGDTENIWAYSDNGTPSVMDCFR
jgi:hypothetical protein